MSNIPKKVIERFVKQTGKFQKILQKAIANDVNEADTVMIVADILSEVFGFDKFSEITSEYAIKNTYCDLAIKLDNEVKYLIEVKAVSSDLKDNHVKQAVTYGANQGIQWVILTNGLLWEGYNITWKQAVESEKIFELNFLSLNPRKANDQELLFLLAKEGINKDAISVYRERVQSINQFVLTAILLNQSTLEVFKRELRKLTPGLKVDLAEIESIFKNDVIKRNIIDDDKFGEAQKRIKKLHSKLSKPKDKEI